jgi:hypothetical protein
MMICSFRAYVVFAASKVCCLCILLLLERGADVTFSDAVSACRPVKLDDRQ